MGRVWGSYAARLMREAPQRPRDPRTRAGRAAPDPRRRANLATNTSRTPELQDNTLKLLSSSMLQYRCSFHTDYGPFFLNLIEQLFSEKVHLWSRVINACCRAVGRLLLRCREMRLM